MLTNKQINMLFRLENGMVWTWHIHPEEDNILLFLMDHNLCMAREDIAPGMLCLTQDGEIALERYRKQTAGQAKKQANYEAAEAKRLQERNEDRADQERRYRTQNKIAVIMPLVTFALGMITEHFSGFLGSLISRLGL